MSNYYMSSYYGIFDYCTSKRKQAKHNPPTKPVRPEKR